MKGHQPMAAGPFLSLTLVLPAYNEEARLGSALDELLGYLRRREVVAREGGIGAAALPPEIEVIVVDDGSKDRTGEIVRSRRAALAVEALDVGERPPVRLELMTVPHGGKGAAVRAGMLAAQGEVCVFADADMATPPDQLPKLVVALEDADVALGSRIQSDGSDMRASQPPYRRFLGSVFHALASWWVAGPVRDTQCGFKGFRREIAVDLFPRQRIGSIVFDVELIYLARKRGYRLAVVPIVWADRRGSRMRPGIKLAARVFWDLFRIPLVHRELRIADGR